MNTTKNNASAHSDSEAHNKVEEEVGASTSSFCPLTFERRLALRRCTASNHRTAGSGRDMFQRVGSQPLDKRRCALAEERIRSKDRCGSFQLLQSTTT